MPKKKPSAEKVAAEMAKMICEHLKTLPEEEQERRIASAERLLANASSAGSRRTSSKAPRIERSRVSRRAR